MKKTFIFIGCGLIALLLLWVAFSFFEINAHNLTSGQYSQYNFFTVFLDIAEKYFGYTP